MDAEIFVSPRFEQSMARSNAWIAQRSFAEVQEFGRRHAADPKTVSRAYDRVTHLQPATVLEIKLGGGGRLLANWEPPRLVLLDVGPHEVVARYAKAWLGRDLELATPAGAGFLHGTVSVDRLLVSVPDQAHTLFGNEDTPGWVYYLTDHQSGIVATIRRHTKQASENHPSLFFIVGGPGTGKTAILAKLLVDLSVDGRTPAITVSDGVAEYLESGSLVSLTSARLSQIEAIGVVPRPAHVPRPDVLLVDDPNGIDDIEAILGYTPTHYRTVVIAFDPYQLESREDLTDETYRMMIEIFEVKAYELRDCYRQKENIGRQAKRVIDRVGSSSPYLEVGKVRDFQEKHVKITALANDLRFPNKHGYLKVYEPSASPSDVRREVARIRAKSLWTHWPPLLLVIDKTTPAAEWKWDQLLEGVEYRRVDLNAEEYSDLGSIKGLEFQHAFIVLGSTLYAGLEKGFEGTGTLRYHRRRLLRIPFSRPKDSLVTFVLPDASGRPARIAATSGRVRVPPPPGYRPG